MPIDNINSQFKNIDKMLDLEKPDKSFGTSTTSEIESQTNSNKCSLLRFDSTESSLEL